MYRLMVAEFTEKDEKRLRTLPFAEAIGYWVTLNSDMPLQPKSHVDRDYKLRLTERIIEHCSPEIKSKTLPEIKYNDLVKMYKVLKNEELFPRVGATTRLKWRKFIVSIFRHLRETGVIIKSPTINWCPETAHSVPTPMIDESVLIKILGKQPENFVEASNRIFIAIGLETGIRLENLCKLTLDDFEYGFTEAGERVIKKIRVLDAKYCVNYESSISHTVSKMIMKYVDEHRPANSKLRNLFVTNKGTPLTQRRAASRLSEMCVREGYSHMSTHQLRVMFATNLAEKTKDIEVIKKALGVNSDDVANRYIRLADEKRTRDFVRENSLVEEYLSVSTDGASSIQAPVNSAVNENSCNTPYSDISDAQNSPKENLVSGSHLDTLVVDNYPKENQVSPTATQFSAMVNMLQQLPPEVANKFYAMMVEQVNSVMMAGMSNLMVPNSSNHQFVKPTFAPNNHHTQSLSAQMRMQ